MSEELDSRYNDSEWLSQRYEIEQGRKKLISKINLYLNSIRYGIYLKQQIHYKIRYNLNEMDLLSLKTIFEKIKRLLEIMPNRKEMEEKYSGFGRF